MSSDELLLLIVLFNCVNLTVHIKSVTPNLQFKPQFTSFYSTKLENTVVSFLMHLDSLMTCNFSYGLTTCGINWQVWWIAIVVLLRICLNLSNNKHYPRAERLNRYLLIFKSCVPIPIVSFCFTAVVWGVTLCNALEKSQQGFPKNSILG